MNLQLKELLDKTEGRYLTAEESAKLLAYGEGLNQRLDALERLEKAEDAILDQVENAVMSRYSEMENDHGPHVRKLVRRDTAYVLRFAGFAMLTLDPNYMHDKITAWWRSIMVALCMMDRIVFSMRELNAACKKHLSDEDAKLLMPYLELHLEELDPRKTEAA